jgi:YbgC/YbaW family acyl-CoA thioester hydrolase
MDATACANYATVLNTAKGRARMETPGAADLRRHRVVERVRWSDIDISGVICWNAYTRFIEIGETELFRAIGYPYSTLWDALDVWLPRVQFRVDFRNPVRMDDELMIESWVGRVGRTSIQLAFAIRRSDGELAAEAELAIVALDKKRRTPTNVPEALVRALAPYRADSGA